MNSWPFYTLEVLLCGLVIFLIVLAVAFYFKWSKVKKIGTVGVIACVLMSVVPFIDLYNRDWSIPECRDESGNLLSENPNCKFP